MRTVKEGLVIYVLPYVISQSRLEGPNLKFLVNALLSVFPLLSTIHNSKIYFYIFDFVESQLGLGARPEKFRKF